jgi:putative N6-adenine-specific DNA methylase
MDPFCGSGTIPIEAAMMGKNVAPGLSREFDSENWPNIPDNIWENVRGEAEGLVKRETEPRLIMGTDRDKNVVGIARHHAKLAGVEDWIHFQKKSLSQFKTSRKYGYVIANPPYGERLSDKEEVEKLYKNMGKKFSSLDTWSFYILSSHPNFEKLYGEKASKRRKLYNGGIKCHYYQYYGPWPSSDNS